MCIILEIWLSNTAFLIQCFVIKIQKTGSTLTPQFLLPPSLRIGSITMESCSADFTLKCCLKFSIFAFTKTTVQAHHFSSGPL